MSNKNNKNEILVKTEQNNLIYIDPASCISSSGEIKGRNVNQEDLVMYVNLEADLIPRTTMIMGDVSNSLTSIAKGTFNMLHNNNGNDLDTSWTEAYTTNKKTQQTDSFYQSDDTGQSFGIDNVQIKVAGANLVPQVSIRFIDVRGKTLFESPENSPYKAFFHLPWPIFYLTIKGYYGKAIRYRLHLVKFSTRFNSSNGNFEVDTTFVGSTYAYLNDIPLKGILNAPYMFAIESDENTTYNEGTGKYTKKIKKTSKGHKMLTSVYNEYKNKGLIDKDFPIKTLRELVVSAGRLDKTLEMEIFNKVVEPKVLSELSDYEKKIQELENNINAWKSKRLSSEYLSEQEVVMYPNKSFETITQQWNKLSDKNKNSYEYITGSTGTLEQILKNGINELNNNLSFGKTPMKLKDNSELSKSLTTIPLSKIEKISDFVRIKGGNVVVNIQGLLIEIYEIQKTFIQKRKAIENIIEIEMNKIITNKDGKKDSAFGFSPTIRNIVAVILANADTYIRLMKNVHQTAFDVSNERKELLKQFSSDSIGDNIYPWPEIKKQSSSGEIGVLTYPGSYDVVNKLKSYNSTLWPEIEFVENFLQVSTYKSDPLTDKEINPELIEYSFEESNNDSVKLNDINLFTSLNTTIPYTNKSYSSLLYEIYERAKYSMSVIPYDNQSIYELADLEFVNVTEGFKNDPDLFGLLKSNITLNKYDGVTDDYKYIYNLLGTMAGISTYERYPYYQSQLPTVDYIKDNNDNDFLITQGKTPTKNHNDYKNLEYFLKNYPLDNTEKYRTSIYPFNSPTYLNQTKFTKHNLKLNGILSTNSSNFDFISSDIEPKLWIKPYFKNLFNNALSFNNEYKVNILNTPYFHKQLYEEFIKPNSEGKYVGTSYLLLNSLPFVDLSDTISNNDKLTLVSTLFREISSAHKIPYHLMIKWGSIYHRYKKYLTEGIDIINGVTSPIDVNLFYDNNISGRIYSGNTGLNKWTVNLNDKDIVGFYPYYQDVFHQTVNDYIFFNHNSSTTEPFTNSIIRGGTNGVLSRSFPFNLRTYTSFVDNKNVNTKNTGSTYTLLPSNGNLKISGVTYNDEIQNNLRIIWNDPSETNYVSPIYSGYTFPNYNEYHLGVSGSSYTMVENHKKVVDLIATFKPDILDVFENAFLEFTNEKLNTELSYKSFSLPYDNFQTLLREIVTVDKKENDTTNSVDIINTIIERQNSKLNEISNKILSNECLINIILQNPREINDYVNGSFTDSSEVINNFGNYDSSQLTTDTQNLIKLYVGDYIDSGNQYDSFFSDNNIALTEENIKLFRPLIYIYMGMKIDGITTDFKTYIKNNINPIAPIIVTDSKLTKFLFGSIETKTKLFLNRLFENIRTYEIPLESQSLTIKRSFNDDAVKLELYNYFKSFNDKWIAGNSIGQRTLMEEFLFLDKANKDIGDQVYIDITKLIPIMDMKNRDLNLYSTLNLLLQNTGFDLKALPSYVNFYGTNFSRTHKIKPSKDVAKNIFGTFLDVDTEESTPKIILQYFGPSSKHLEMSDIDKKIKFKGDGFNLADTNNNPIIVAPEYFRNVDYSKSNRAVAFEVSVGDQNQSMFKSIELDQTSIKNTTESFDVIERLGNSAAGSSTSQIDIGLFDIYRQASYECTVKSMGNVMIQPTMFFYLKNVPMFRGSYWISEVTHDIKSSGIDTTFKGSRIPMQSLPKPEDSFMASYRALFDKMLQKAETKVKTENNLKGTEKAIDINGMTYFYDMGTGKTINGEEILKEAGINRIGLSFNGFNGEKYIQKISRNKQTWLRSVVITMGGTNYEIDDDMDMSILSNINGGKIKWGDIKNTNNKFYSTKFNGKPKFIEANLISTIFLNPLNNKSLTINTDLSTYSKTYNGPVTIGPAIEGCGVGLSPTLMSSLGLKDYDVVYFNFDIVPMD